jgi:hypothetical protein
MDHFFLRSTTRPRPQNFKKTAAFLFEYKTVREFDSVRQKPSRWKGLPGDMERHFLDGREKSHVTQKPNDRFQNDLAKKERIRSN